MRPRAPTHRHLSLAIHNPKIVWYNTDMKKFQQIALVGTVILGLNLAIPLFTMAQSKTDTPVCPMNATTCSLGKETIEPGIFQLTSVPANFKIPPANLSGLKTVNVIHVNNKFNDSIPATVNDPNPDTPNPLKEAEKLTAEDKRFSGGFEVQVTASDYVGKKKQTNRITVDNLGILTQVPAAAADYDQTTNFPNDYQREGVLLDNSQKAGTVLTLTLPFNFTMFKRESKVLYICTNGLIIQGADTAMSPDSFKSICTEENTLAATPAAPTPDVASSPSQQTATQNPAPQNLPANPPNPPAGSSYGMLIPYFSNFTFTTSNLAPFNKDNGVYYQQISDNEAYLRFKGNIVAPDGTNAAGSSTYGPAIPTATVEYGVYLYKDGRIEFHYGPNNDNSLLKGKDVAELYNSDGQTMAIPTAQPFASVVSGSLPGSALAFRQIRFLPRSTIFNGISKPGTPPVYATINSLSNNDPENFTMFAPDGSNDGFSSPLTVIQAPACATQGRLGDYTVYPSFLLQIPGTTRTDIYQNSITFTIIDETYPTTPAQQATAQATVNENGSLSAISLTNSGYGYNAPPVVAIDPPPADGTSQPAGTTATAVAVLGGIGQITVTNGGSGYNSSNPPAVSIDPPPAASAGSSSTTDVGEQATATATVDQTGTITGITIHSVGAGYTSIPNVTIAPPPATNANSNTQASSDTQTLATPGMQATATATIGAISQIDITDSGSGYDPQSAPAITIAPPAVFCPA
jgi:hypothetical protein